MDDTAYDGIFPLPWKG